jgi:hypothetical protein
LLKKENMTIDELELLKRLLIIFSSYDCCSDAMLEDETDKARRAIDRDIEERLLEIRK